MNKFVLMDSESSITGTHGSITFTITCIPATFTTTKVDVTTTDTTHPSLRARKKIVKANVNKFILHKEDAITIILKDAANFIYDFCDKTNNNAKKNEIDRKIISDIRKRFDSDTISDVKSMDFEPAMRFLFSEYIPKHGNQLVAFCILSDLKFFENTQNKLGTKPIFRDIGIYPATGLLVKKPSPILIDARSIIADRCKKFMGDYINYIAKLDHETKKEMTMNHEQIVRTKLETFMTFIRKTRKNEIYVQTHSSFQDVEDLFELLSLSIQYDGLGIFDGNSYLHEVQCFSDQFKCQATLCPITNN